MSSENQYAKTAGASEGTLAEIPVELIEKLAEYVHDAWARARRAEGWVYGSHRDDQGKQHPGLVGYAELSEAEKEIDRVTAAETLRAVVELGYRILPPESQRTVEPDESSVRASHQVVEAGGSQAWIYEHSALSIRDLVLAVRSLPPEQRWSNGEHAEWLIERLLESNEPLVAFDLVSEALSRLPRRLRLRQLYGLTLARSGAKQRASQVFRTLLEEGHQDEETLGNLARSYKSLWETARDDTERRNYLGKAYSAYLHSYQKTKGYWSGINVAFLALMQGNEVSARSVAAEVSNLCVDLLRTDEANYWLHATIAEASMIQNDIERAKSWYAQASRLAGSRLGNVASTRRQAKRIADYLQLNWDDLNDCFPVPSVFAFDSSVLAELDASNESSVQNCVRALAIQLMQNRDRVVVYVAPKSLVDLVFLETILDGGGNVVVLLSSEEKSDDFSESQLKRFSGVLERCQATHALAARKTSGGTAEGLYSKRILLGLAVMRAAQFGVEPEQVSIVPAQGRSRVLNANAANLWELQAHACTASAAGEGESKRTHPVSEEIISLEPRIMSLLFADVKGFSQLREPQLLRFAREFLGAVAQYMRSFDAQPTTRHTWGDGLFFTFETVRAAGRFALSLADLIDQVDWAQHGLPPDLNIRIGLHAGPVYECFDPISEQTTFMGIHVNHAARIEPITPPGNVYASEAFAALACQQNVPEFSCEYVGRTALAKGFGMFSTYHVRHSPKS